MTPLLTLEQAAEALGIDYETCRKWCRTGKLRASQPGRHYRIRVRDVEALLEATVVSTPKALTPAKSGRRLLPQPRERSRGIPD